MLASGHEGLPPATPDVSVTVVLFNSDTHLRETLEALASETARCAAEILVVDNASPDQSARIVSQQLPEAQLIYSPINVGFAAACNLTWPRARGRYWLLLNPDAVFDQGSLHNLIAWMDAHPQVAIASPWLRDGAGGPRKYPGRRFPSVALSLLELARLHRILPRRTQGRLLQGAYLDDYSDAPHTDRWTTDWVPGTAMIVRRDAAADVGLLDEAFFLYGEDIEWCWRMRRNGWKVGVCSGAAVIHRERSSTDRTLPASEAEDRIANGFLQACELMHGRVYAAIFGLTSALALLMESYHPRRPFETRQHARMASRAWARAAIAHLFRRAADGSGASRPAVTPQPGLERSRDETCDER